MDVDVVVPAALFTYVTLANLLKKKIPSVHCKIIKKKLKVYC